MNILVISDEPERKSFGQILSLKKEIQRLGRNKVDLFVFSNMGIFLNKRRVGKKADMALKLLESLMSEKTYGSIVVSLKLNNLEKLFPKKRDILDLIKDASPQTDTFLFGASSVFSKLGKRRTNRVYLYSRPGVAKLTCKFKNDVIDHINAKKSE